MDGRGRKETQTLQLGLPGFTVRLVGLGQVEHMRRAWFFRRQRLKAERTHLEVFKENSATRVVPYFDTHTHTHPWPLARDTTKRQLKLKQDTTRAGVCCNP